MVTDSITREVVNGKQATVSHLTDTLEPCAPADAAMVKVVFDDGGVLFGVRKADGPMAIRNLNGETEWC